MDVGGCDPRAAVLATLLLMLLPSMASAESCEVAADIEFLLDTSGSVGPRNFEKVKDFVLSFTETFEVGPTGLNVGIVTFSDSARNVFWLNRYTTNKTELLEAISAVSYPKGGTRTDKGLKFVREKAFTEEHGDRPGVVNLLVVVTDGRSNAKNKTLAEAELMHQTDVNVFAVGVGFNLDHGELAAVASRPENVFLVDSFKALAELTGNLQDSACLINGNWSEWGPYDDCSATCGGGYQSRERTCTNPAPAKGGDYCLGEAYQTQMCNVDPCPTASLIPSSERRLCQVTGDPHLLTFGGYSATVAVPCMYHVTKLRVPLTTASPYTSHNPYQEMEVDVFASNGRVTIKGQYYVSDVRVKVTVLEAQRGVMVPVHSGTFSTGYSQIEAVSDDQQKANSAWTHEADQYVLDRVQLIFDSTLRSASLRVEGVTPTVHFRPVNMAEGLRQSLLPGVIVEVGSDVSLSSDQRALFPSTLCSSPGDRRGLRARAARPQLPRRAYGVFAVLEQGLNQTMGGDPGRCSAAIDVYAGCPDRTEALARCSPLVTEDVMVTCLTETDVEAFDAFADCLSYVCKGDDSACLSLQGLGLECPALAELVQPECGESFTISL